MPEKPKPPAEDDGFDAVHAHLRRLAARELQGWKAGQSLTPTDLAHEAILKVQRRIGAFDPVRMKVAAAREIHTLLIDHARARGARKRGGDRQRLALDLVGDVPGGGCVDMLEIDDALQELERLDARQAELVRLKIFGGMTTAELAAHFERSTRTVELDWTMARTWLAKRLRLGEDS